VIQTTKNTKNIFCEKFCKGCAWWDCSDNATLGECAFIRGECRGAPVESEPETYYSKWRRLFTPIYANIPKPEMDTYGHLISSSTKLMPKRKKSTRRQRIVL